MSANHDISRVVRSWIREEEYDSADRVLEVVLSRLDSTPQRRSWWSARRFSAMNKYIPLAAAAAAVLVVAVVGYNFLPDRGSGGPNATRSPSPAPLAVGSFTAHGVAAQIDANGAGDNVTGTLTVSDEGGRATVDLECARTTEGGLLAIGGLVTDSTYADYFPNGYRVGVIFERGSPVNAVWWVAMLDEAPAATCQALLEGVVDAEASEGMEPISGTVDLAP